MIQPLKALFAPETVAVIGASRNEESVGYAILKNLLQSKYKGQLYPVNPKTDEILELKSYASVKDIPEKVELAFIAIPRDGVVQVVVECVDKGVKAVVVISAGFKEVDEAGEELEEKLAAIAREHDMALLGPNCLGVINTDEKVQLNGTFVSQTPKKGNISFISQSGAVGVYALEYADKYQIDFAKFASLGNKAVTDENDILEAYAEDEQTKVILAYLEEFSDPQRFLALATRLKAQTEPKPLVVLKAGRSQSGQRAAQSHTGALTESDEVTDHLFDQYSIIRVDNLERLFYAARLFATQQLPQGNRLCIVTNAGGPGIITADAAEKAGLKVPALSEELQEKLSQNLPRTASTANPVDLVGDASSERYRKALEALVDSDELNIILCLCTPQLMTDMEEIAQTIGQHAGKARENSKMLVAVFADFEPRSTISSILAKHRVLYYRFGHNAVEACADALKYSRITSLPQENPETYKVAKKRPEEILSKALQRDNKFLTEPEGYEILEAYGLQVSPYKVVSSKEDTKAAAKDLIFPLVAKVVSEQVVHKTDADGVVTDILNEEELLKAFDKLHENVKNKKPEASIKGILVQQMVQQGTELIVGVNYSEKYGHLLMFGVGGILVEMLHDVTFRRVPITRNDAMAMIEGIRSQKVLQGLRGKPAPDKAALANCLLRLNQLVQDFPQIKEVDLNPVFGLENSALLADARIIVRE
ncbi:acetate--CoA ligase [Pontibacter korlensis]|uniref:ATP-grasp domain-containing protein n=1 Tax=Pontibacter korlensis TaxID=400092 RepID=A0A0E3ZIY6_9BACT|nr:acetate--CoA ligase [Pontibacter korlensis]AKD05328.1 hypothetical protein PKOR_22560 [Pontibacter korlensis]